MALGYIHQHRLTLIGSKSGTTRTGVTLTSGYGSASTSKIFDAGEMSKVNFSIFYAVGSGEAANSIKIKIESSSDGTNLYQIPNESVSGGTSTLTLREFVFVAASTASAGNNISLPLDVQDRYLKISVKESGTSTNFGTAYVEVLVSGAK